MDFWKRLLWFSKPELTALFTFWQRHMCYMLPGIHLWCCTCQPLDGQCGGKSLIGITAEVRCRLDRFPGHWHNGSTFVFCAGDYWFDPKPIPISTHACWEATGRQAICQEVGRCTTRSGFQGKEMQAWSWIRISHTEVEHCTIVPCNPDFFCRFSLSFSLRRTYEIRALHDFFWGGVGWGGGNSKPFSTLICG